MRKSTSVNKRNGEIEFLRILFCVIVFVYHVSLDSLSKKQIFTNGNFGVEFFFIISGIFMSIYVEKRQNNIDKKNLGQESISFVVNKYKSFFWYHLVAFVCGTRIFFYNSDPMVLDKKIDYLLRFIPQFFMIQMGGLVHVKLMVSVEWYISAMLIAMLIMYPIMRLNYDFFSKVCAPLLSICIAGYASSVRGNMIGMYDWNVWTTWGVLRAIMLLSCGCVVYEMSKVLNKHIDGKATEKSKLFTRWIYSGATLAGYWLVVHMLSYTFNERARFGLVIILMMCVTFTFTGKSVYSKLFNNSFVYYLGKVSLPMYLNTNIVRFIFIENNWSPTMRYRYLVIASVLMNFAISAVEMFIIDTIKKQVAKKTA